MLLDDLTDDCDVEVITMLVVLSVDVCADLVIVTLVAVVTIIDLVTDFDVDVLADMRYVKVSAAVVTKLKFAVALPFEESIYC